MRIAPTRTRQRNGFTLLELILALGLTVTLLTALYAAMELHWKFSTLGEVEVERAQIARALMSRMGADIRSATFNLEDVYSTDASSSDDESSEGDGTDDGSSDDSSDDTIEEEPFQFAEPGIAFTGATSGVYGDSQTLVIHLSRPYRERNRSDAMAGPTPRSDLKSVAYFLAEGEGMLSQTAMVQIGGTESPQQGLVRMDGDRLSLSLSDAQDEPLEDSSRTRVVAEEIDYLSFEYHDGYEWLSDWDSTYQGRLPNAVGITIGFRAPEYAEGSILARTPAESTDTYRIVVPLVSSAPFEGLSF